MTPYTECAMHSGVCMCAYRMIFHCVCHYRLYVYRISALFHYDDLRTVPIGRDQLPRSSNRHRLSSFGRRRLVVVVASDCCRSAICMTTIIKLYTYAATIMHNNALLCVPNTNAALTFFFLLLLFFCFFFSVCRIQRFEGYARGTERLCCI
jgi:hypothetical protein